MRLIFFLKNWDIDKGIGPIDYNIKRATKKTVDTLYFRGLDSMGIFQLAADLKFLYSDSEEIKLAKLAKYFWPGLEDNLEEYSGRLTAKLGEETQWFHYLLRKNPKLATEEFQHRSDCRSRLFTIMAYLVDGSIDKAEALVTAMEREFKEILLELDTIVFSLLQTKMEKIGRAALKSGNPNDIIEEQRNAARDIASGV